MACKPPPRCPARPPLPPDLQDADGPDGASEFLVTLLDADGNALAEYYSDAGCIDAPLYSQCPSLSPGKFVISCLNSDHPCPMRLEVYKTGSCGDEPATDATSTTDDTSTANRPEPNIDAGPEEAPAAGSASSGSSSDPSSSGGASVPAAVTATVEAPAPPPGSLWAAPWGLQSWQVGAAVRCLMATCSCACLPGLHGRPACGCPPARLPACLPTYSLMSLLLKVHLPSSHAAGMPCPPCSSPALVLLPPQVPPAQRRGR